MIDLQKVPKEGQVYRHYKGGRYMVLYVATLESDKSAVVVYRNVEDTDSRVWVRPLSVWCEEVQWPNGSTWPRFL
jgi:hypothetical protein